MNASDLDAEFESFHQLTHELCLDVETAMEDFIAEGSSQHRRRAYVRAALGFIEGTIAWQKRFILMTHQLLHSRHQQLNVGRPQVSPKLWRALQQGQTLTESELALVREKQYDLDDRGEARSQSKFLRLKANIRFTFACLAKVLGLDQGMVDFTGEGWWHLVSAVDVRNRITHPRTLTDAQVSDDDMSAVITGLSWFMASVCNLHGQEGNKVAT